MYFKNLMYLFIAALIIGSQSFLLFAQQIDRKVLSLRAQSFQNIESMVAGRMVKISSPLKALAESIKKSEDSRVFYDHVLREKKRAVLNKFQRFGVNTNDIEKHRIKDEENSAQASSSQVLPSALRKRARGVFALFTDQPVALIEAEDEDSPAKATDSRVSLDRKNIKKFKADEQQYLFAHEIVHFLEKHWTEEITIKKLLKEKHGPLTTTMRRYLLELSRCNETIADIRAVVIGGIKIAQGFEGFARKEVEEQKEWEEVKDPTNARNSTHPARPQRYAQAKLLKKELELLKR